MTAWLLFTWTLLASADSTPRAFAPSADEGRRATAPLRYGRPPLATITVDPADVRRPLSRDLFGVALHFEPNYAPGDPWDEDNQRIYPELIRRLVPLHMGSARLSDAVSNWLAYDPPYENVHAVYSTEDLDHLVEWYTATGVTKPVVELNDIACDEFLALNASLVAHARDCNYGIRYWEIGNESYCRYTAPFYANVVRANADRIRAVDPQALIGIALAGDPWTQEWNQQVLELTTGYIDFVCPHYYSTWFESHPPNPLPPDIVEIVYAATMAGPQFWQARLQQLAHTVTQFVGSHGQPLEIIITEWNVDYGGQVLDPNCLPHFPARLGSCLTGAIYVGAWLEMLLHDPQLEVVTAAHLWRVLDFAGTPLLGYELFAPLPEYYAFELFGQKMLGWLIGTSVNGPTFDTVGWGVIEPATGLPVLAAIGSADTSITFPLPEDPWQLGILVTNRAFETDVPTTFHIAGPDVRWFRRAWELNALAPNLPPEEAVLESNNRGPLHPGQEEEWTWVERVGILDKGALLVDMAFDYVLPAHSITVFQLKQIRDVGDYSCDGDIDLRDAAALQLCFSPTALLPPDAPCTLFDFDHNSTVDASDFVNFCSAISGPN